MAFNLAALHAATDNLALTVRTIEAAAVTLEADRAALVARVQGWSDADWEAGPLAALGVQYAEIAALRNKIKATAKSLCDQALPAVGLSLSDWYGSLRTMGQRLPPEFGQLVRANAGQILPLYVWPPLNTDMGEVLKPGAPTNITLVTAPIDTKQYAGGVIKSKIKTAPLVTSGAGNLTLTILGTQYNGDAWGGVITITSGSIVGVEDIAVPSIANTFCTQITSIVVTCVGAETWTAGDLDILTDDDRAPAA
jgi:hypothetical protein